MGSLVRDGVISPLELVDAHLRQIARRNRDLNAFVTVYEESARDTARQLVRGERRGLLHAVPVTVKDSFDMEGEPTRVGSLSRPTLPAARDSVAVARLRAAGAIIIGRTNTAEMLADYECTNAITGCTNNPWDLERTPGGSSGGEAAAIAAHCSAGGIGSDGGGSIRIPAHFCGVAGMKPTAGRIPGIGHFPGLGYPSGMMTSVGPMARTAKDLRLLFSALAGHDPQDPFSAPVPLREPALSELRIGVWERFYDVPIDPEIAQAVAHAAAMLTAQGFAVDEFSPAGLERVPNVWAFLFSRWPHEAKERNAEEVLTHFVLRDQLRASLLRQMEGVAAILMPVCNATAFRHAEPKVMVQGKALGHFQIAMPSVVANVLGLPALALPVALSSGGLPIGVQLVGRPYEDELLLEIAIRLEEARGAWTGPPE
jgi:amidase